MHGSGFFSRGDRGLVVTVCKRGLATRLRFPSLHDDIDVFGIEFDETGASTSTFGGDHRRARAAEGIEDDATWQGLRARGIEVLGVAFIGAAADGATQM